MARLLVAALLAAGCYSPTIGNGSLPCSNDKRCPSGYACAIDGRCWTPGTGPDGGVPFDLASLPDLAPPGEGGMADLAGPADLASPDDQAPPDDLSMPDDAGPDTPDM